MEHAPTSRRAFLQRSGLLLSTLAIACTDEELVAGPGTQETPRPPPIPVTPPSDLPIATDIAAPTAFRAENGELLAYVDRDTTYFWPAGGNRAGLRVLITTDRRSFGGGYGLQLDRARGINGPLEVIYSLDGDRQWEIGLDSGDDASGLGAPDFVLAYDNAHPPGDRLRMAPGGYLRHGPIIGTPRLEHRLHIQGGRADGFDNDRATNVLYVQAGAEDAPGIAEWLVRGEGRNPLSGEWGYRNFGVTVDGGVQGTSLSVDGPPGAPGWTLAARRWGATPLSDGLALNRGETMRFFFSRTGAGFADAGWYTFSPEPPRPASRMTAREWSDWAHEDAAKAVKPYDGVPSESHPHIRERAAREGRDPADLAEADQRRYGKDISRIAIGTANWAHLVQDALERARTFEEFRRLLGDAEPREP